jgi:hypothetical protein
LQRWLREAGLWRRQRRRKPYRQRRERKAHFGELVQMDGRFHEWLEERGPRGCLMHMGDDATTAALGRFSEEETIWAAAAVLRGEVPVTQFGRMCAQLGIRIIAASSRQAKGRVDRAHGTHQDRLVKKLRLAANYDQANAYLDVHYRGEHNRRYARPAAEAADYHRRRPTARQLDQVFWLEEERVVSEDWVVRYNNHRLLPLERQSQHWAPAKSRVLVRENEAGKIAIHYRGQRLLFRELKAASSAERGKGFGVHPKSETGD